ncbi:molybdopterin molybdotransferase MoeA [Brevibacterium album]|uniref:molybdopterin molybdotransferase MoeA n=1 Tax=Brevibacterium album TaxID=417948 RepID=UPI0006841B13|nr:molybdopterin molybdotransferase MoeA [Brevibacterium album]
MTTGDPHPAPQQSEDRAAPAITGGHEAPSDRWQAPACEREALSDRHEAFADWREARSMDEHIAEIVRVLSVRELGTETIPAERAGGRVLAAELLAPLSLPPFDNSQMDGFAVRAADTPGRFAVEGMIAAGHPGSYGEGGSAARASGGGPGCDAGSEARPDLPLATPIMTGAPVPPDADAVVPVEETEGFGAPVITVGEVEPGRFVRPAGSDIAAGEVALEAGAVLHPAALGLLSALGLTEVVVRRRPRVLLVAGGDEVAAPGEPLRPGQIYDANTALMRVVVEEAGAETAGALTVDDTVDDFRAALTRAVRTLAPDLVVTSGGISAGEFEVVRLALASGAELGEGIVAEAGFGSVRMQPGGPQGLGVLRVGPVERRRGDARSAGGAAEAEGAGSAHGAEDRSEAACRVPVVCFPGNPVSTWTSAQLLLREAMATAWGVGRPLSRVAAVLEEDVPSLSSKTQVRRAMVTQGGAAPAAPAAELRVRALPGSSSHLLARAVEANAFLVVPAGGGVVPAGSVLEAVLLTAL